MNRREFQPFFYIASAAAGPELHFHSQDFREALLIHPDAGQQSHARNTRAPADLQVGGIQVEVGVFLPLQRALSPLLLLLFEPAGNAALRASLPTLSKIKQLLVRKAGPRVREALVETIGRALAAITLEDAASWFAHAGYGSQDQHL